MSHRRIEMTVTLVVDAEGVTPAATARDMHMNATLRLGYVMGRCIASDFSRHKPNDSRTFEIDGTSTFRNLIATVTTKEIDL